MGRRGKKVTGQKRESVLKLLETHAPRTVAHQTNLSLSEVYKIRRETRAATSEVVSKVVQDIRELIPESMPAEEFLVLHGNELAPLIPKMLELTKPRCRLHPSQLPEETTIEFEEMSKEECQRYDAQSATRLEQIIKQAKELNPFPPTPAPSPDMYWDTLNKRWVNIYEYAKENSYQVVEENQRKFIDGRSIIAKYIGTQGEAG